MRFISLVSYLGRSGVFDLQSRTATYHKAAMEKPWTGNNCRSSRKVLFAANQSANFKIVPYLQVIFVNFITKRNNRSSLDCFRYDFELFNYSLKGYLEIGKPDTDPSALLEAINMKDFPRPAKSSLMFEQKLKNFPSKEKQ